jgi:hypothetical protein
MTLIGVTYRTNSLRENGLKATPVLELIILLLLASNPLGDASFKKGLRLSVSLFSIYKFSGTSN